MSTSGVILDFYGTIAHAVDWGPSLVEILDHHGLPLSEEARSWWASVTLDGVDHRAHSSSRDEYVAWERQRLGRLAAECGASERLLEEVVDELYRSTKTYELALYEEVREVLADLERRQVRVAVCSNWDWDLPEVVARLGLDGAFDPLVTSARVGFRKPHPRIYEHTLEALGLAPARCLFVGDSWDPDVVGPLAHGMRAVHLAREPLADPPPLPRGVARVADLREMLEHL